MKIKIVNFILMFALVFSLSSCAQTTKESKNATTIGQKENFKKLISPEDLNAVLGDIQLIDVRTPQEFASGRIKGSENINYFDDNFVEQMSKLDKNKILYIYCRSGNRSGKAASKLKDAGFTKVYDLQGGMKNWNKSNLEIIK